MEIPDHIKHASQHKIFKLINSNGIVTNSGFYREGRSQMKDNQEAYTSGGGSNDPLLDRED